MSGTAEHLHDVVSVQMDEQDAYFMREAIKEAYCAASVNTAYNVGALLVVPEAYADTLGLSPTPEASAAYGMRILYRGHSRELPGNTHAEECCLLKLPAALRQQLQQLSTATTQDQSITMYTTMEPCVKRLSGRPSCTERLLEAAFVGRIVLGVHEPPTFVQGVNGVQQLRDNGRIVRVLQGWEKECLAPNQHVLPPQ